MKPCLLRLLGAVGAVLLAAISVHAQPYFVHEISIECVVLNAETVVVGKIVDFKKSKDAFEATLAVDDTLKGEHRERLRIPLNLYESRVANWKRDASPLLVALAGEFLAADFIDLASPQLAVRQADFKILRKPDDVLRAARQTIRRSPGVIRIATVELGVPDTEYAYRGRVFVTVPVDAELEKRMHGNIETGDRRQRTEAARVLRYFKSDENIAKLKALLKDTGLEFVRQAEDGPGIEVRSYTVREAAFATLKYWGVHADKPVLEAKVANYEGVTSINLGGKKVTVASLKELDRFKNLESLDLKNAEVTEEALKELARFENLRGLNLDGRKVTDAWMKHVVALKGLRWLNLEGARMSAAAWQELAGLQNLDWLYLASTNFDDAALKHLAGMKNLASLNVDNTRLTDASLKELSGLKALQFLYIRETRVTEAGIAELRKALPGAVIHR